MENKVDWSEWYDMTRLQPPNKLLVDAVSHIKNTGKAIDIGGGALRDARYLLQKGFEVTVIDKNPLLEKEVAKIDNGRLHSFVTSFEDFPFPVNEYVLASAMQSLSYCEPKDIQKSRRGKGVLKGYGNYLTSRGRDGKGPYKTLAYLQLHRTEMTLPTV